MDRIVCVNGYLMRVWAYRKVVILPFQYLVKFMNDRGAGLPVDELLEKAVGHHEILAFGRIPMTPIFSASRHSSRIFSLAHQKFHL